MGQSAELHTSQLHPKRTGYCTSSNLIEAGIVTVIGTLGGVRPEQPAAPGGKIKYRRAAAPSG